MCRVVKESKKSILRDNPRIHPRYTHPKQLGIKIISIRECEWVSWESDWVNCLGFSGIIDLQI